ncbi:histidine phosphatase family protein [Vreelandella neptunia]|uniref:Histidine phosphatase family protein n=1 Tax=Vreelandella neptunia TaxID=115551 RepID=A0ABS9S5V9_9GAMM|nr:histidine phosphatase family protein [Halomonas neptunia]MCH4811493.1 histidine phosphatase family protein [Halomonas neptunia]
MIRNLVGFLPLLITALLCAQSAYAQSTVQTLDIESEEGAALLGRLREGGLVMFIRHADTAGQQCDTYNYSAGRAGQRNISPTGREQAVQLGERIEELEIPIAEPILSGPVYRARDTAELAFGVDRVSVTDSLLADDYARGRLDWVLSEHRRLFSEPVAKGENRVLVGHRTPAQMIFGSIVSGTGLPEAGVLVLEPRVSEDSKLLGVLEIVPAIDGGNPPCS